MKHEILSLMDIKKIISVLILFFINYQNSVAQKDTLCHCSINFSKDLNGISNMFFTDTVGLSKNVLFNRIRTFIFSQYNSGKSVLQNSDSLLGEIVITPAISERFTCKGGFGCGSDGEFFYTASFLIKEGRYRIEITNIRWIPRVPGIVARGTGFYDEEVPKDWDNVLIRKRNIKQWNEMKLSFVAKISLLNSRLHKFLITQSNVPDF